MMIASAVLATAVICTPATVIRVIDGDTIVASAHVGYGISILARYRLKDFDAPETKGEDKEKGALVKKYVQGMLPVGKEIRVCVDKKDSFGRWIADVYVDDVNLADHLIDTGYGERKEYR